MSHPAPARRREEDSKALAVATDAQKNDPLWDSPRPSRAPPSEEAAAAFGDYAHAKACAAVARDEAEWEEGSGSCSSCCAKEPDTGGCFCSSKKLLLLLPQNGYCCKVFCDD